MAGINRLPRLLAILVMAFSAIAQLAGATAFEEGNKHFEEGEFEEALAKYNELVGARAWSPNLFHNLGNTEYRLKHSGLAILNYERALALEPAHPEARRNLELVRTHTGAKLLEAKWWQQLFPSWRANVYAIATALAVWVLVFSLVLLRLRRVRSRMLWWGFATLGLLVAVYSGATLLLDWQREDLGIITRSGAAARFAPADRAQVAQSLPEGSQVRILSERGAWVYCALPGNELGWLPAQSVERVRIREK